MPDFFFLRESDWQISGQFSLMSQQMILALLNQEAEQNSGYNFFNLGPPH